MSREEPIEEQRVDRDHRHHDDAGAEAIAEGPFIADRAPIPGRLNENQRQEQGKRAELEPLGPAQRDDEVPTATPGASPMATGIRRARTAASPRRLTHSTDALSATSIGTSAGFKTRFVRNSRARGTVIDENPYPSAPLTTAATAVMTNELGRVGELHQDLLRSLR